jgi:small-conductance mechanosensitive channel
MLGVDSLTDAGVMCSLEVWVRTEDRRALRNDILLEIVEAMEKAGLRMAFQKPTDAAPEEDAAEKRVGKAPIDHGKVSPNKKG